MKGSAEERNEWAGRRSGASHVTGESSPIHAFHTITSADWKRSIDGARAEPNVAWEQIKKASAGFRKLKGPASSKTDQ